MSVAHVCRLSPRAIAPLILPILVATFVLAVLVPFADRDPVAGVTASNGPFSDEAWNILGARNLVLLGRFTTDSWNTWLLTLPFTILQVAVFALFGSGSCRRAWWSSASLPRPRRCIASGLRPLVGGRAATVAAIGYATSALVLFYGRLAFLEPLVGLFLAAGTLALRHIDGPRAWRWASSVGSHSPSRSRRRRWRSCPSWRCSPLSPSGRSGGEAPVGGSSGRSRAESSSPWHGPDSSCGRIGDAVAVVVTQIYPPLGLPTSGHALASSISNFFWGRSGDNAVLLALPLLAFALAGSIRAAYLWRRGTLRGGPVAAGAAAALAASLAVLAVVGYRPNRYLVAFLPEAAILAGWAMAGVERLPQRRSWIATVVAVAILGRPRPDPPRGLDERRRVAAPVDPEGGVKAIPPGSIIAGGYSPLVGLRVPAVTIVTRGAQDPLNVGDLYAAGAGYVVSGKRARPGRASSSRLGRSARAVLLQLGQGCGTVVPVRVALIVSDVVTSQLVCRRPHRGIR